MLQTVKNLKPRFKMGGNYFGRVSAKKDLGVMVALKLNV